MFSEYRRGSVTGMHPICQLHSLLSTTVVCQYRHIVLLQSRRTPCIAKVQPQAKCVSIGKLYFSRAVTKQQKILVKYEIRK